MTRARSIHAKRKRLLFLGDSLIEYFDWAARFPEHEVYNLGIAGETIRGLAARLERILQKVQDPDMVFIMSGINSIAMGEEGTADVYRSIVRAMHQAFPAAQIFVQSLLPVRFPYIDNDDIVRMNRSLRHIAAEEQVSFLDLYTLFTDKNMLPIGQYLLDDGVHVSDEGYRIWSEAIEPLLR